MGMGEDPVQNLSGRKEAGKLNGWEHVVTWQEQQVRKGANADEMGDR